jgi:hypothetical protein
MTTLTGAILLAAIVCAPAARTAWRYIELTDSHSAGFGLALGDLTGDGYADIASCNHFYRNPGGDIDGVWEHTRFPVSVDASIIMDIDGDAFGDVFGSSCGVQYWLEARDSRGDAWQSVRVGAVSDICNHGTGPQGYLAADLIKGGREEIIMTERTSQSGSVILFVVPDDPHAGDWPHIRISSQSNGESVAAADFDQDGDLDVCGAWSGGSVCWWENPGSMSPDWIRHDVGETGEHSAERCAAGDIDGDSYADILVSEENMGEADDCRVLWFRNPGPSGAWQRFVIAVQNGTFGMSVGDCDNDGDLDVCTGENGRGSYDGTEETVVWLNDGTGQTWEKRLVATGKESHHGSRLHDMDADGDLDIVSICFDTYRYIHLWQNNAAASVALPRPRLSDRRARGDAVPVTALGRRMCYKTGAAWGVIMFCAPLHDRSAHGGIFEIRRQHAGGP